MLLFVVAAALSVPAAAAPPSESVIIERLLTRLHAHGIPMDVTSLVENNNEITPFLQHAPLSTYPRDSDELKTVITTPKSYSTKPPVLEILCPSISPSYLEYMESQRMVPTESLLQQVHELAFNFALINSPLMYAGFDDNDDLENIRRVFSSATRVENVAHLNKAISDVNKPSFFIFGSRRTRGSPSLTRARALAVARSLHGPRSVMLFSGAASFSEPTSPCPIDSNICEPTTIELVALLCSTAPHLNQGIWKGVFRVYPPVRAPWSIIMPTPVIPPSLWAAFTLNSTISIGSLYIQNLITVGEHPITHQTLALNSAAEGVVVWDTMRIANFESIADSRGEAYYGYVDTLLYKILSRHPISGKAVVIMGSLEPFYELVALSHGAKAVTTIEYGKRITEDPRFEIMTPAAMRTQPRKFDIALSISSLEHDGLGRYGDPVDPDGDLNAMHFIRDELLRPGGALILAVPSGGDFIEFNAHRIYGRKRLPLLFDGWTLGDSEGFNEIIWDNCCGWQIQPIYYLIKK